MSRGPEQRTKRLWCRQVSVKKETVASTSFTKTMTKTRVHDVVQYGSNRRKRRGMKKQRFRSRGKRGAKRTEEGKRKANEKTNSNK